MSVTVQTMQQIFKLITKILCNSFRQLGLLPLHCLAVSTHTLRNLMHSLQSNHQNKCWKCTFCQTRDMLKLDISLCLVLYFKRGQCCSYDLVRYRHKNHLMRKRSYFGVKYVFWLPQTQLEMSSLLVKNKMFQSSQTQLANCFEVSLKICIFTTC